MLLSHWIGLLLEVGLLSFIATMVYSIWVDRRYRQ